MGATTKTWRLKNVLILGTVTIFTIGCLYLLVLNNWGMLWNGDRSASNTSEPQKISCSEPELNLCKLAALNPQKWCQYEEIRRKCPGQCPAWMFEYVSESETDKMML